MNYLRAGVCASALACLFAACASPAFAGEIGVIEREAGEAVFGFAGRYAAGHIEESIVPFFTNFQDAYVVGGGYQTFFAEPLDDLHLGVEIGAAARFADPFSGELWTGFVARYDGFVVADTLRVSPSVTLGISAVSNTGAIEAKRSPGDAALMFYFAPELAFALAADPSSEIFYRLHHRSSAWGTLGPLGHDHNAQVVGFRHRF